MSDTDQIVSEVNASMTIEGMPLTEADKERIHLAISSKEQFQKILQELILKYSA